MRRMLFVVALGLAGCTSVETAYDHNGDPVKVIDCSEIELSMNACYARAKEECPRGYILQNRQDEQNGYSAGFTGTYAYLTPKRTRTLTVKCK